MAVILLVVMLTWARNRSKPTIIKPDDPNDPDQIIVKRKVKKTFGLDYGTTYSCIAMVDSKLDGKEVKA